MFEAEIIGRHRLDPYFSDEMMIDEYSEQIVSLKVQVHADPYSTVKILPNLVPL